MFLISKKNVIFASINKFNVDLKVIKTMARRKKIIQVPRQNIDALAKAVGCKNVSVWNALAFRSDSENAKQIRRLAMSAYGGIETYRIIL